MGRKRCGMTQGSACSKLSAENDFELFFYFLPPTFFSYLLRVDEVGWKDVEGKRIEQ